MCLAALLCSVIADGDKAVFDFSPLTNSVLWVPVDKATLNCRVTCRTANMVSVVGGATATGAKVSPPAVLCANLGGLTSAVTYDTALAYQVFLDEGTTRPTDKGAAFCVSYLQNVALRQDSFACGCIPPKKKDVMQAWIGSSATCPSTHFQAPFICRVPTADNVFIGHLHTQNCGFPFLTAPSNGNCPYGGGINQPASGWTEVTPPTAKNYPTVVLSAQGPQCIYRNELVGGQQIAVGNVPLPGTPIYQILCIRKTFTYWVYVPPKAPAGSPP